MVATKPAAPPITVEYLLLAPPEQVFAFLTDVESHTRWSGQDRILRITPGALRVGALFETRGPWLFHRGRSILQVTALEPNRLFAFECRIQFLRTIVSRWSYTLTRTEEGATWVRHALEGMEPRLLYAVIARLLRRAVRFRMEPGQARIMAIFNTHAARRRYAPSGMPGAGSRP